MSICEKHNITLTILSDGVCCYMECPFYFAGHQGNNRLDNCRLFGRLTTADYGSPLRSKWCLQFTKKSESIPLHFKVCEDCPDGEYMCHLGCEWIREEQK